MKILIACEFSGTVRDTFVALGHDVTSCDLEATEKPGKHYQGNVLDIINDGWDLMIAHPPCTYLTVTGNKWMKDQPPRKSGALVGAERRAAREEAKDFFMLLANAPIERIAIENPIGVMSTLWRKPDQVVHPWQFGHEASKSTCLWLKNLPLLIPTNIVGKGEFLEYKSGKRCTKWYADAAKETPEMRAKIRNRTFQGIADAMATQWGKLIPNQFMRTLFLFMLIPAAAFAQRTDVCKSDSVVAVLPGEGQVQIQRRGCRVILMSDTLYQNLMVEAVQADSMREAIPVYIEAVKAESDARKKAQEELERFSKIQEVTIAGYEERLDKALDACQKTATDLDNCEDNLEKETTRRKWAWFKGLGVGILTGAAAVVTAILL